MITSDHLRNTSGMRRIPTLRVAGDLKGHDREICNTNVLRPVHLHHRSVSARLHRASTESTLSFGSTTPPLSFGSIDRLPHVSSQSHSQVNRPYTSRHAGYSRQVVTKLLRTYSLICSSVCTAGPGATSVATSALNAPVCATLRANFHASVKMARSASCAK